MSYYVNPMTVEERSKYKRINRFYKQGENWTDINGRNHQMYHLKKSRGLGMLSNVGRFYLINVITNTIVEENVDIDEIISKRLG